VAIERLATGGDGVGHLSDGRAVFVPRSAPGDLVELAGIRRHARYARARLGRLVRAGPGRVPPRCGHYQGDDCGGCQLQHLGAAVQLQAKRAIMQDALTRIARLDFPVPPVIPAPAQWGYRHRITLAVGPGRRFAGFHRLDQPASAFPLERCEIAAPEVQALWLLVRPHLQLLPPDAGHLVLRLDREGNRHIIVRSRGEQAWGRAAGLAQRLGADQRVTLWWHPDGGAPRVVGGISGARSAPVFEQVYPEFADRIRAHALDRLEPLAGLHAWDLYAGVGDATRALVARGATVESVELDPRAVELAEHEGEAGEPAADRPRVVRHAGKVEEVGPRLQAPDVVIANPPRTGMGAEVVAQLLARRPRRLAYVSCDPTTLARDLGRLCAPAPGTAGFRLAGLQSFDLFPQTAHLETVALLEAGG
jgi:23S rRNA (uracil1939-C5)-methyltransferase